MFVYVPYISYNSCKSFALMHLESQNVQHCHDPFCLPEAIGNNAMTQLIYGMGIMDIKDLFLHFSLTVKQRIKILIRLLIDGKVNPYIRSLHL